MRRWLILAYWLISLLRVSAFRPTFVETVIVLLLALAYFALVTVPTQPLALFILPPLLLIVLLTLYRNRRVETRVSLLVLLAPYPVRLANALAPWRCRSPPRRSTRWPSRWISH